ncbi:septal ring lytic transglycosylase RlpA [Aliidiomarina minuta]|uniref:Endolytic peptidoglycan transglycosylase RlpA n=1 Tax=Aliidiomarina minuta TaxID=880057 RepID=A0A432W5C9_9GAMM|nr:septal ring lytic transglycosylase RlpA family protein [Aliidiomarina minuta]RUO25275.1 septal ring lytic transglycosylase RlpA [Aliidiomarina minuta]
MLARLFIFAILFALLSACAGKPEGRYQMRNDQAPARLPTSAEIEPLTPRFEPLSRQGNMSSYTVLGETYQVMQSAEDYQATGIASWYGQKFHGHLTSNGEYYDMYSLSAAHRYLPLPSYVRVTNLANNKEVIVRVNDRGPFHPERVIDLSFAAAYKLDMLDTGTARVHIESIHMPPPMLVDTETLYIQVAATSNENNLLALKNNLQEIYALDATTRERAGLHRLLLGPFSESQANQWLYKLRQDGYEQAFRVED